MTKHPVKTIITLAVTLLIGLCLGALICYGTIGTDTPVPGQSQATPRKGTAMQHANQQELTFAKPGHTGKGTRKVFLNASQNAEGNTSSLAKELMGGGGARTTGRSTCPSTGYPRWARAMATSPRSGTSSRGRM